MGDLRPFDRDDGSTTANGGRDGAVRLIRDPVTFRYYIDAPVGHTGSQLAAMLRHVRSSGLDVFDALDEDPGDLLPDGGARIWLTPINDDAALNPLLPARR